MLKFVSGDLFDYDASVRINTVNCVGVMGKGVALAYKNRYPAMFKEYKAACDDGDVQPGQLHIWKSDDGTVVVNFPTKRHWRQKSLIKDVESGLKALREFLLQQGDVRVTLPALGCGHGGLEWEEVSDLIRQYLSDMPAEVLVFAPAASRNAANALENGVDAATKQELIDAGITTLTNDDGALPKSLSALGLGKIYVQGDAECLNESRVACLCSTSPNEREIAAATICVEELAEAGVPIICGFGAKIERRLIKTVLEHDGSVIISLPSGILDFKVPKDMRPVWDDRRIAVVSSCGPRQRWTSGGAREASRVSLGLSKSVLITDNEPKRWKSLVSQVRKDHAMHVSYVDYQQNGPDLKAMQSIAAIPIRRNKETGRPNIDHIIENVLGPPPPGRKTVRWSGTVPPQEWMNFYTKVLSKLASDPDLALKVTFEVPAKHEQAESKADETRTGLRELGLDDDVQVG